MTSTNEENKEYISLKKKISYLEKKINNLTNENEELKQTNTFYLSEIENLSEIEEYLRTLLHSEKNNNLLHLRRLECFFES